MTQEELDVLNDARLDVLRQLREKYGDDKVQQVDDLGEATTMRMLNGEKIYGLEQWMYDLVFDFQELLLSHPSIHITRH